MAVWAGFWILGLIWGSSFLLIKIGLEGFTPLQLVAVRVIVAAVAMVLALRLTGQRFPRDRQSRLGLLVVGVFNTAVPFVLITWGEQRITSGLATVLNATVPLFSLVIAHFALRDERITPLKVAGLICGFLGVVVLAGQSFGQAGEENNIVGQFAVLLASLCYAGATVFVRRSLRHLKPMVISSGALVTASVIVGSAALLVDGLPAFGDFSIRITGGVLVLGLVNTFIAYLLYYWIIDRWGATRATLVTYVMPPVGLALGAIVLDEPITAALILGAGLIGAGVFLVNSKVRQSAVQPLPASAAVGAAPAASGDK